MKILIMFTEVVAVYNDTKFIRSSQFFLFLRLFILALAQRRFEPYPCDAGAVLQQLSYHHIMELDAGRYVGQ